MSGVTMGSDSASTDLDATASLVSRSADREVATESVRLPVEAALWMPWCGVLINTATLATRLELSRYDGSYIRDSITAELAQSTHVR
jgi:hypothetical protein